AGVDRDNSIQHAATKTFQRPRAKANARGSEARGPDSPVNAGLIATAAEGTVSSIARESARLGLETSRSPSEDEGERCRCGAELFRIRHLNAFDLGTSGLFPG